MNTATSNLSTTVLLSGTGTTLAGLLSAAGSGAPFCVNHVISNDPNAGGLALAAKAGIPTHTFPRSSYSSLAEQKSAVLAQVVETNPDLVVLAGFMMVLQPQFIDRFPMRILNIHPSLLPKYPGLDTYSRALQAQEKIHGSSVHFVDAGVDTGPLVAQVTVPIERDETTDSLKIKVQRRERDLFPWVISALARKIIWIEDRTILFNSTAESEAESSGFTLFGKRC